MAALFRRLFVTGINPVVNASAKGQLRADDLKAVGDSVPVAYQDFLRNWETELAKQGLAKAPAGAPAAKNKPSLLAALKATFMKEVLQAAVLKLFWGIFIVVSAAVLVRQLLQWLNTYTPGGDKGLGWGLSFIFFACCLGLSFSLQQMNYKASATALRVRSALTTALYRKALKIDLNAPSAGGDALSLVSTDTLKISEAATSLNYLWSGILEALAIIAILLGLVGKAALPGLGLLVLLLPFQVWMGMLAAKLRKRTVAASDQRVSKMEEILKAAKLVKAYALENSFAELVASIRGHETKTLALSGLIKSINLMVVFSLPPMIALLIFATYAHDGNLDSVTAFTTLSLFNTLRLPLVILPKSLRATAEAISALKRVEDYLLQPEAAEVPRGDKPGIFMKDASFTYASLLEDKTRAPVLRGLNVSILPGQLIMIVGPVSAGKSSFLQAILGNMSLTGGSYSSGGKIAYLPQSPWCQHLTARDNILFGKPFDEARYRAVVHACSLASDFAIMESGDLTMIAERGINLSGGQKQRLALARAAYSDADVFLLDSPLSALDNFVAQHVFQHLFKTFLKGKTIILVTHALEMLHHADTILLLKDGVPAYCGVPAPEVIRAHFGNVVAVTPDTDVQVEAAAQAATAEVMAIVEAETGVHSSANPDAEDEKRSTYSDPDGSAGISAVASLNGTTGVSFGNNNNNPAVVVDNGSGAGLPPRPRHPHPSTPLVAARSARATIFSPATATTSTSALEDLPAPEQHEVISRAYSRRAELITALQGAGTLDSGSVGMTPDTIKTARQRSATLGGVAAAAGVPSLSSRRGSHAIDTDGRNSNSSKEDGIGPLPFTHAKIPPAPSPTTRSASNSIDLTTHSSSASAAAIVGAESIRKSRSNRTSSLAIPPAPGILIAATATANSARASTAIVPTPNDTTAVAVPAIGVDMTNDPSRPQRPARQEEKINGYLALIGQIGWVLFLISVSIFIITQVCRIYSDIWISVWVAANRSGLAATKPNGEYWYVEMYAGYVFLFMVLLFTRGFFFYTICRRATSRMHDQMFRAILHAPLSWFSVSPLGKVLSTFSRDIDILDEGLQDAVMMVLIYACILGTTAGVVIRVLPLFAVVIGVLLVAFGYFFYLYIKASRVIKTAAGERLNMLVAHVSESLQGMVVVRAFDAEERFAAENMQRLETLQVANGNLEILQVWLSCRLDTLCSMLVLAVALLVVGLSGNGEVTSSAAGLAISNGFQLLLFFSLMVRGAAEIDSNIASAERVHALTRVEPEKDLPLTHESCPLPSWPQKGEIVFSGVQMAYAPSLPLVLRGVDIRLLPASKIGVVGRTGAGKSSLVIALFRLAELAGGSISIDNVDISKLNLAMLRSRIAILPQEPVVFAGSLRYNLDPFDRVKDEELLAVIEKCHLGDWLRSNPAGLQFTISAGGGNVSLGTAQLICLARALLNRSKVLVLDEATAALDLETDSKVQKVIRQEFADRTIICIAHRLDSIIDSDKILVMDSGRCAEFASPLSLLRNPNSIFSKLCRNAGPQQHEALILAAEQHERTLNALAEEVREEAKLSEIQENSNLAEAAGLIVGHEDAGEGGEEGGASGAADVVVNMNTTGAH